MGLDPEVGGWRGCCLKGLRGSSTDCSCELVDDLEKLTVWSTFVGEIRFGIVELL